MFCKGKKLKSRRFHFWKKHGDDLVPKFPTSKNHTEQQNDYPLYIQTSHIQTTSFVNEGTEKTHKLQITSSEVQNMINQETTTLRQKHHDLNVKYETAQVLE